MVLEKTLESPMDSEEIKPVNLKRKLYILSGNSALPTIEKVVTKKQDSLNKTQNLL